MTPAAAGGPPPLLFSLPNKLGLRWLVLLRLVLSCSWRTVMYHVARIVDELTAIAGQFDRQQWVLISIVVLVIGLVSMRGFGSRNNY